MYLFTQDKKNIFNILAVDYINALRKQINDFKLI